MATLLAGTVRRLFGRKAIEASYPALPEVDASGQTNVPGIYCVGEIAGTPLVKLGLNAGHEIIQQIGAELQGTQAAGGSDVLDLVIVGSGSSGLAATVAAKDMGLSHVTLEAAAFANTFVTMTKCKWLFAEPLDVEQVSRVWFEECTKEDLLARWRELKEEEGLEIHEQEKVVDIKGAMDAFTVQTDQATYQARRVILALGKAGNPRKLGVPGEKEHAERIHHRLLDPDDFRNQQVVIVGAGDVACEAAIALAKDGTNTVTLSAIDEEFTFPKKRNVDAVRALEAENRLRILLGSSVQRVGDETLELKLGDGTSEDVPYDTLFEMIGAELPLRFFKQVGIRLEGAWHGKRWATLFGMFTFVYSLYALKSYGKGSATAWPFEGWISAASYDGVVGSIFKVAFLPFSWVFSDQALTDLQADRGFQQGYLYSLLYTIVMTLFGWMALMRWRQKAKRPRYQTWRYASLMAFQLVFFLGVNLVAVKAMSVQYSWRAWGLYQPFPLYFNTFFWWYPSDAAWLKWLLMGGGVLGTLGAIPFLAWKQGKRFCTWVCGCGGLAETLGDRWRHLSPKGARSRAWEFQGALIMLWAFLVLAIVVVQYETDGNNGWWRAYNYLVDFWLVAVIPIALYPFYGGKVWCRYWCPLAAFNQLLSRWYGRLKITSNDKCITCTECSKYCQVGVDVMAFAKNQEPFDNTNSACIHCGICIDVCPVDVLAFDSGPRGV